MSFFLLVVPLGELKTSPANTALDIVKRRLGIFYTSGQKADILKTINRTVSEIVKTGLIAGIGLATLLLLLTIKPLGPFSALMAIAGLALGIILTDIIVQNEYKRWQDELYSGVPTVVNFLPAFLEVDCVTAMDALTYTLPFIQGPLQEEMENMTNKIRRTAMVHEATSSLVKKANLPIIEAICFRISAAWDTKITADIFDDLSDQVDSINEMLITKETTKKTGYLTLVCVLGLVGVILIFGYPGIQFLMQQVNSSFI